MLSSVTAPADDSALDYGHGQSRSPPQNSYGRPRATTAAAPSNSDALSSSDYRPLTTEALNNAYQGASPSLSSSTLYRSASEGQAALSSSSRDLQKSPMPPLDPSQFPDPYPFRPHHPNFSSVPTLSSAGSSSTRSSAYTSSGSAMASGDYGHVHVATGDDDASAVGVGITSDDVVQLLAIDATSASSARPMLSRAPIDQSRWSESYSSSSVRSRSSSIGNSGENIPKLNQKPSFDISWQTVDERDEVGMSEEETDDDQHLSDDDDGLEEKEEERTSAAVVADEGRGLIVHGDNVPVTQLHVQPGTTHLLIGSSTTPNAMPVFLANTLPQIHLSLLALDISANFLGALPPVLAICENLEELNIASNPLRVLPVFLADLTNLRVLIADSTGISTLPEPLADLDKLHTISVRRNKLHALPSWLCLLPVLQTLCVDGNPFQGPWKALVEPLLAKTPISPMYPPSTPIFPPPPASLQSPAMDMEADTDLDDLSDSAPPSANVDGSLQPEDHTITAERLPSYNRSVASAIPDPADQSRGLIRTRTTPNRAHFDQTRAAKTSNATETGQRMSSKQLEDPPEREVRKMKSAGDLRRGKTATTAPVPSPNIEFGASSPSRPGLRTYGASLSSSNLLNFSPSPERPASTKRFATLGPASSMGNNQGRPSPNGMRPQLTRSLWDNNAERDEIEQGPNRVSYAAGTISSSNHANDEKSLSRPRSTKDKGSRWGFLKKMSMGKMKPDPSTPGVNPGHSGQSNRFHTPTGLSASPSPAPVPSVRSDNLPQIDMRFSTTGTLDGLHSALNTPSSPPSLSKSPSTDLLKSTVENNANSSPSLLMPPSSLPKTSKRRSFLPIDAPGAVSLNIPITDATPFVPGLTAANGADDCEGLLTPSTPAADHEHVMRREAERFREAYMRALRSVMAYLKDMNDLSLLQQPNSMSVYGTVPDDLSSSRSRRPTVVDNHRDGSHPEYTGQLRSSESIAGLRSGTASQTLSVATTDSTSSQEERERKFKDDKGKRAMVVREIVLTERTYVKGLQELVDIYIKPASVPVNILSGVGSGKDTVVPAAERRLVFGGVEALFTFHKDNFLPALEVAAAPLMKPSGELQYADADGQLSLAVVRSVASMFLKHAAFMKMYSSYINNFDSSVQRVKYWSSDRNTPGSASPGTPALSPSSSTAQLVGLGLSMTAVTSPNLSSENNPGANGVPNLTSGQRKRIKSYLKRCRMNPRHSQLNLEGYLLLPVQRIPRYRLLLEELHRSTPPSYDYRDDPLDRALAEISSLASNMNEGKREAESRRKLVQWQSRIRGRFPSPLVQPHRRLIMDGPLLLTRVVRKATVSFEAINAQGDASTVQVDCLAPELTPRPLIGILCNDLLVLCRDPSEGQDPASSVDLWAVLRMQTLPQPASIVHGNALRLVDNKAILYFDAPSPSDALNWYRAINLHIPASKA